MSETNRIEYKQELNNDMDTRQNYKLAELKECCFRAWRG